MVNIWRDVQGINQILWSRIGVNLNYEDKWVENSRVLSLYAKKNYARDVLQEGS